MTEFQGKAAAEFFYGNGTAPEKKEEERMTDDYHNLRLEYDALWDTTAELRAENERLKEFRDTIEAIALSLRMLHKGHIRDYSLYRLEGALLKLKEDKS